MHKYLQIFKISFQQEFAYRVSFVMWRVRNVFQIFLVFFLWDAIFSDPARNLFGYDRTKILTYVFGLIIVKALVFSTRIRDVAWDISQGSISNHLLKPISYFKYWLTRDISSKFLNLIFAIFETLILFLILKPPFFIQTNPIAILGFISAIIIAIFIFFTLLFIISSLTFWYPETGWGVHFLVTVVIVEFLSGALFPIDILPSLFQDIVYLLPFPYLVFFPLQVYLGKISGLIFIKGFIISAVWAVILWIILNSIWRKGIKAYQAYGR